jgi:hypothetical protein
MKKPRFFVLPTGNPLVEKMLYLALALVFVATSFMVGLQLYQNKQLKDIAEGQSQIIAANDKSLRCILAFFATPERAEYYLSDLATCSITRIDNGETKKLDLPPPPPVDHPPSSSNGPQTNTSSNGGSQQGSPSVSPDGNASPATPPPSTPPPSTPPSTPPSNPPPSEPEPSIIEDIINNTTDFTCGLVGLLCR